MKLWEFIPELVQALEIQLRNDDVRWGNTWVERTREGQEERTIKTYKDYFDQYENAGTPIPWMKIIGNAMICWIREQHPEMWSK